MVSTTNKARPIFNNPIQVFSSILWCYSTNPPLDSSLSYTTPVHARGSRVQSWWVTFASLSLSLYWPLSSRRQGKGESSSSINGTLIWSHPGSTNNLFMDYIRHIFYVSARLVSIIVLNTPLMKYEWRGVVLLGNNVRSSIRIWTRVSWGISGMMSWSARAFVTIIGLLIRLRGFLFVPSSFFIIYILY